MDKKKKDYYNLNKFKMSDTYTGTCKECEREGDCVQGICTACEAGDYFCDCGNDMTKQEMEIFTVCQECI